MIERLGDFVGLMSIIPMLGIFAISFYYFYCRGHIKRYPPGPRGLPVLGHVTKLGDNPANTLSILAEQYGNVFSVQIGLENWVILNDYTSIRQALIKQNDDFSGRPRLLLLRQMSEGLGLIFRQYGPHWRTQKKFVIAKLRELGVGKKRLEELIADEANQLVEEISSRKGKAFDTQNLFAKAAGNIVCELVLGSRFPYDDKTYSTLVNCLDTTFFGKYTAPSILALLVAPVTRFLPSFRATYHKFCRDLSTTFEILSELIEDRKKNFDEDDIRSLVDEFLKVMRTKGSNDSTFTERQIFQLVRELFVAGSVNVSAVIRWCLLSFANNPRYQGMIYDEVVKVIGESGIPTMKHRDEMPFTCAFIQEILRHRTLVPLSMPHSTTVNTKLAGYEIPKNTPVLTNLWAVHHDPEQFDEPSSFRPDRFIDEEGKFQHSSHVIPFSIGPRFCLGEQMAKIAIFIFVVAIVQRYKVVPDPKKPLPNLNEGVFGVLCVPPNFEVSFKERVENEI